MTKEDALARQRRATEIAYRLLILKVSNRGVQELIAGYPLDVIERQLDYLPYRNAKRPEALIMDAVRNNYSPPKEFFYATNETQPSLDREVLDEGSELPSGETASDPF